MIVNRFQAARRGGDEAGAYLILWALLLVALLTMVAIVIDLGQTRANKRVNQSVADMAAFAAGPNLAPDSGGATHVPQACKDALTYVKANAPGFPQGPGINMDLGCDSLPTCVVGSEPATSTTISHDFNEYTVKISYPVSAAEIQDTRFASNSGANDGSSSCERLKVTVIRRNDTLFAGVIGRTAPDSVASAVVRGFPTWDSTHVPALLLLERRDCAVLQTSGGSSGLEVLANGTTAGLIHADSVGELSGSYCNGTNTPNGYVIYGGTSGPSVKADDAGTTAGRIDLWAITAGNGVRAAYQVPTGVYNTPTGGQIASRIATDYRYNDNTSGNPNPHACSFTRSSVSNKPCITALETDASFFFGKSTGYYSSNPAWQVVNGGNCTPNSPLTINLTTAKPNLFVDCASASGWKPQGSGTITVNGASGTPGLLVTSGPITAANTVTINGMDSVYIAGSGNDSDNSSGLDVPGALCLNVGSAACSTAATAVCPSGTQPFFTALVIKTGQFTTSSSSGFHMCNTFMHAGVSAATPQQTVSPGNSPILCSNALPCPQSNNKNGLFHIHGNIEWTAPRSNPGPPTTTSPWEGLLFWSESGANGPTSNDDSLEGQSSIVANGVVFAPNAQVTFHGNGSNTQANAQFISSRLNLNGTSRLLLSPDPNDSVPIAYPNWILIR